MKNQNQIPAPYQFIGLSSFPLIGIALFWGMEGVAILACILGAASVVVYATEPLWRKKVK
jgi:hypothetical protein